MICDGVMPSNEGRGYVLRRLLRRAARHGKLLGIEDAFLCKICDVVIDESKSAYPELEDKRDFIKKVIQIEEESFSRTVDSGMTMLNRIIEKHRETGSLVFSATTRSAQRHLRLPGPDDRDIGGTRADA